MDPISGGFSSEWTNGLFEHLEADGNGLARRPRADQAVSTLLVEDYGTCGLPGDVRQTNDTATEFKGRRNHFFHFWRAIGSSGKNSGERGSWGLGKTVLPASSQVNAFFGLSCQDDGAMRLMGMAVLRHHHAATDRTGDEPFKPYGWFGTSSTDSGATAPVLDDPTIERFCHEFGVERRGRPGLSVVVLMPHDNIAAPTLVAAAIVQYFFPILEGQLVVEIAYGSEQIVIDADKIGDHADKYERYLTEQGVTHAVLKDTLRLARWSIEQKKAHAVRLKASADGPRWTDDVFNVPGWSKVTEDYAQGNPVELVIPLVLSPKSGGEEHAEFSVTLQRAADDQPAKVFFLRDGITITDIRESRSIARGLTAFVTPDSGALASYLRLAEDPSHTRWEESGRLKQHYNSHALPLRFVKNSVRSIHNQLTRPKEGIDVDLLADLFFVEAPPDELHPLPTPAGRGGKPQRPHIPVLVRPPEPVRISARESAIVIAGIEENVAASEVFEIKLAYDVRRGDAFAKWSPFDFDLADLDLTWTGAQRIDAQGATLLFAVVEPNFQIVVRGLDATRDLRIRTRRQVQS